MSGLVAPGALDGERIVVSGHPVAADILAIANPASMIESSVALRHAPPLAGRHADVVLTETRGSERLESVRQSGALG